MDDPSTLPDLAQLWRQRDPTTLLSQRLQDLNAGSPTDWGMSPRQPDPTRRPISLAGGIPDPATLPRRALMRAAARALDLDPNDPNADPFGPDDGDTVDDAPLSYGGAYGYTPLRSGIARTFGRDHDPAIDAEHLILTNGAAGAIDLVCSALLDPGDVVVTEVPAFSGSLRTFRGHQARVLGVPMDGGGLRLDALEERLERLEREGTPAKLIYASPTFHNPTGTTMPLERRRRLIALAARHGALILEDTAYNELYFGEALLPSLGALSQSRFVVTVGTFSKVIGPGLRVGWLQGSPELLRAMMPARFDMGNSPLLHRTLHQIMASGDLERHVARMRGIYRAKMTRLAEALRARCGDRLSFTEPEGGFFLWARLAPGLDAETVRERAIDDGLRFPIGAAFYQAEGAGEEGQHLRLAYSRATLDDLEEGVARLERCLG